MAPTQKYDAVNHTLTFCFPCPHAPSIFGAKMSGIINAVPPYY
uniref:Uncharacterized protein n=1 Tax=Anguilla anguilla TaxID=7936 RepID=A0A0E9RXF6_ANGAN